MKKNRIRLTESDLKQMVKESVNKILNEFADTEDGLRKLHSLTGRNAARVRQNDNYHRGTPSHEESRGINRDYYEKLEDSGIDTYDGYGDRQKAEFLEATKITAQKFRNALSLFDTFIKKAEDPNERKDFYKNGYMHNLQQDLQEQMYDFLQYVIGYSREYLGMDGYRLEYGPY